MEHILNPLVKTDVYNLFGESHYFSIVGQQIGIIL